MQLRAPHPEALAAAPEADGEPVRIVRAELDQLETVYALNLAIFDEERIINTFDREDLLMLLAYVGDLPVGFKVGYRESRFVFYSAKGGTLPEYRRRGVARLMLDEMLRITREMGFSRFAYDTFPNRHPGMTIMGLQLGFRVTKADYNSVYKDYRLRLECKL